MKASDVIAQLHLEPLEIEGGFFHELYRCAERVSVDGRMRTLGTSIYYMLQGKGISDWHRVASDEIWYYHGGSSAVQLLLYPDGTWEKVTIGSNLLEGERPQSVIPAGTWQAAVLSDSSDTSWGLFGASVFPGFEYEDFELGKGADLAERYPDAASLMYALGLA